jgi:hypothetical protein
MAIAPLLFHVVIVHPLVLQFLLPSALSQRLDPVTHPGEYAMVADTTEFVANAVLFVVLESPGLEIDTLKVTLVPPAAGSGITGIRKVSHTRDAIVVVLVQVTVVPTVAPQDHPLSTKGLLGPEILAGSVRIVVCIPDDVRLPALVRVIGSCDIYQVVSGHSGCPIPGIRSTTLVDTYGRSLHSIVHENVVAAGVPKSQFAPNPRSPPVVWTAFVKLTPLVI